MTENKTNEFHPKSEKAQLSQLHANYESASFKLNSIEKRYFERPVESGPNYHPFGKHFLPLSTRPHTTDGHPDSQCLSRRSLI